MMQKTQLRILLIGYGKMGRAIEQIAKERGHSLVACISDRQGDIAQICRSFQPNIAFEFTSPESAAQNIRALLSTGIPVVSGSTGWLDEWESISALTSEKKGSFFYASNFSLGMNLLFHLTGIAAKFLNSYPEYDISIEEIHHTDKKDMPSGTAITLAERLIRETPRKKSWKLNAESSDDIIGINSLRQANVPGTHIVSFSSAIETIQLSHTAHSRMGFAQGAVLAAEWLMGKTGVFTMEDLMKDQFS